MCDLAGPRTQAKIGNPVTSILTRTHILILVTVEAIVGNVNHLSKSESLDYSCEALRYLHPLPVI